MRMFALLPGGLVSEAKADAAPVSLEIQTARRAGEGDRAAQTWLARRLTARTRKVARALTSNAADADDAAQLALIEILRSAINFRGESSLEHWAGRIAVRTTLRFLERERRRTEPVPSTNDVEPREPLSDAMPRDVRQYLAQLSEIQRTAIVLHHALGYSFEEVAEMTNVSRNTVKSRLRLGTAALRKLVRREQRIGAAPVGRLA
jgi:RNA polymerase sigma-70 factor (ECF subfamily)